LTRNSHIFETKIPNGPLGDPVVYCLSQKTGEALLLDLGDLSNLSNKEILKVRHIAVSHTHLDHFIGFDRLLRVNVPHFKPFEICGPTGLIKNVQGKMNAYCWNLLEPGQIRIRVREIARDGAVTTALLSNDHGFDPVFEPHVEPSFSPDDPPPPKKPAVCAMILDDGTRVEAIVVDHGTPVCAYMLQSPSRYYVRDGALDDLGLEAGSWIRELQMTMAARESDKPFEVGGKTWRTGDLAARLLNRVQSRSLAYLTDFIFNEDNLARLKCAFSDVEKIVCETNYRTTERDRATQKKHLTTKQAALIAASLKARDLETFHISNLYTDRVDLAQEEAQRFFQEFRALDPNDLQAEIAAELDPSR
jgi:ribonuclease Z